MVKHASQHGAGSVQGSENTTEGLGLGSTSGAQVGGSGQTTPVALEIQIPSTSKGPPSGSPKAQAVQMGPNNKPKF